jgi:type III pantothenate kinase
MNASPRDDRTLNEDTTLIAVSVGNTSTQIAAFSSPLRSTEPDWVKSCPADDAQAALAIIKQADAELSERHDDAPRLIAVASVNAPASQLLLDRVRSDMATALVRVPEELPVPIRVATDPDARTGVDRLLAAAAAYTTLKQACAVVDAGTAITVDFIDGEGTFQGGVIAPGLQMGLAAMHQRTAALPELRYETPDPAEPFPKNTAQAMLQGVYHGARGLVRSVVERYAEAYEGYPTVIACGGDAGALFRDDEFIDRVVPDLVLRGIAIAYRSAVNGADDDDESDDNQPTA